jgi:hypothetical protein
MYMCMLIYEYVHISGELAIKVGGASMAPYVTRLMHSFIQVFYSIFMF